ncbi:MAG: PPC domain-containing DNA-binding protein [Bacilli bacterium]|jgi:predicted DNA-binding protein with PD1-like motif|nr:DNA-binding protein [Acholeplasmataceae bacterium]
MEYQKFNNHYVIRLDPGDAIIESIKKVAITENITLGSINGIGAVKSFTVGFFNPETKFYQEHTFNGYYEITTLLGNITTHNNEPYLHVHGTFGDDQYRIIGGHLKEAIISVTSEIVISTIDGTINRKMGEVGINILDLAKSKE